MTDQLLYSLLVFVGGGCGALTRYGVGNIGIFDHDKYYYTVIINITGCLLIGIISALLHHFNAGRAWGLLLMTGFLGGYTTYSAYTLDLIQLFEAGMPLRALAYCGITIFGAMAVCLFGLWTTRRILGDI